MAVQESHEMCVGGMKVNVRNDEFGIVCVSDIDKGIEWKVSDEQGHEAATCMLDENGAVRVGFDGKSKRFRTFIFAGRPPRLLIVDEKSNKVLFNLIIK
jgi:hypothetical protein